MAAGAILLPAFQPPEDRGKDLFARRCGGCHDADRNKEGPALRGVYGRNAAGAPGFSYSDALRNAHFRWDEAGLERWLSDPDSVAPGTGMDFQVKDAEERAAIVAYLKSLSGKRR
ncbi:MAG TPA: c-type cytochrome [Bryobacteraceae bacterium]|jgi:cytochrome c|nr:c-type cytochrome [Bryobacteraceae bacterium]